MNTDCRGMASLLLFQCLDAPLARRAKLVRRRPQTDRQIDADTDSLNPQQKTMLGATGRGPERIDSSKSDPRCVAALALPSSTAALALPSPTLPSLMTLDKLTVTHYASLLAACWRALGTLEVEDPRITGVFGVEDYDHPSNRCGMLEATCTHSGQPVSLTGPRMLPLAHGYHRSGPNSDVAGGDPRPYLITGGSRASGVGMPDLALIRLPAPALDARLARLLLSQPHAIIGMLALVWCACNYGSVPYGTTVLLLTVERLVETLGALCIARVSLGLGATDACRWAGLVALGGFGCTRQLLRLRGPTPPLDRAKKD